MRFIHAGDEESINEDSDREQETGKMLRRNWLAVAAGHVLPEEGEPQNHLQERTANTELDLQQLRRGKDCKALAGEYVTTQHKPVVFEVRMKKWKGNRTMGPKSTNWWKYKEEMIVEYREMVRRKYEELGADM